MLALLNDAAIMSIAYDNVRYKNRPEAWNMRLVLGMATILGVVGPIAAIILFYLGDRVFDLGHPQLQTMMYLMLSVAGHLTIFMTRTRGPFWSIRPARILWIAVLGTQILATTIAVLGIFVTPLDWKWAAFVWAYAIGWFFVTDRIKLLGYRILDPAKPGTATNDDNAVTDHDNSAHTSRTVQANSAVTSAQATDADQATKVDSFHTNTDPDGVYHDNDGCPYGNEVKSHGNDRPGRQHRRRCDWCSQHPVPV
jgi:H+-transporting ATPase